MRKPSKAYTLSAAKIEGRGVWGFDRERTKALMWCGFVASRIAARGALGMNYRGLPRSCKRALCQLFWKLMFLYLLVTAAGLWSRRMYAKTDAKVTTGTNTMQLETCSLDSLSPYSKPFIEAGITYD